MAAPSRGYQPSGAAPRFADPYATRQPVAASSDMPGQMQAAAATEEKPSPTVDEDQTTEPRRRRRRLSSTAFAPNTLITPHRRRRAERAATETRGQAVPANLGGSNAGDSEEE
jgi:hypothetical protein